MRIRINRRGHNNEDNNNEHYDNEHKLCYTTATGSDMPSALGPVHPLKCKIFIYQNQSAISMSATISTSKSTAERVEPARYTCDILEYLLKLMPTADSTEESENGGDRAE